MSKRSVAAERSLVNPSDDELRLGLDIANRIQHACNPESRRAAYAGRSFGEFLAACRKVGITDATDLRSIDFGNTEFGSGYVVADDIDGAVRLRELR